MQLNMYRVRFVALNKNNSTNECTGVLQITVYREKPFCKTGIDETDW